jgi:hypothetical protein
MEKPQARPTRHICFAALGEYHVESTVPISSIDERAPIGIENSLRLSSSMCSSLSGRAPKISHKAHSSKLFALVVLQAGAVAVSAETTNCLVEVARQSAVAPCSLI